MNWKDDGLLRFLRTEAGSWMIVIRILVVAVVILRYSGEGLLPAFVRLPAHAHIGAAPLAGSGALSSVEIICAAFVLAGLLTRLATVPLLIISLLTIMSSKLPHLNAHDIINFHAADADRYGVWSIVHDVRADFVILFGSVFLLYEGAGRLSLDWWLASRPSVVKAASTPTRPKFPLSKPGE